MARNSYNEGRTKQSSFYKPTQPHSIPNLKMHSFKAHFVIIEENNCPLYHVGEEFLLTGQAFSASGKKEACLILVREMTQLLFTLLSETETGDGLDCSTVYSCSGCNGLIKFRVTAVSDSGAKEEKHLALNPEQEELFNKIIGCPFFAQIPADYLKGMIQLFREKKIARGQILIEKGERNQDIFIVLSGELSVDDGPVHITRLGPGELCGEMSYFAGNIAGATVTGFCETAVIAVGGELFSRIIEESPSVQLFLSQLLANRLLLANKARLDDFDSSMQGRLSEMEPSELFQILHMHRKTGILSFTFPGKKGRVAFCEGRVVKASCDRLVNREAVYAVLAETEGSYQFRSGLSPAQMKSEEIADFNALLMEGMQRIDEGSASG